MQALAIGDKAACTTMLSSASAAITKRLAGLATESASSISQAVVQLQMLQLLGEASASRSELTMLPPQGDLHSPHFISRTLHNLLHDSKSIAYKVSRTSTAVSIALGSVISGAAMGRGDHARPLEGLHAGLETRLQLYEPLVTLQKQVARLLGRPDMASQMLLCLATAARKNGRLPIAMNALHELQATLRCVDVAQRIHLW